MKPTQPLTQQLWPNNWFVKRTQQFLVCTQLNTNLWDSYFEAQIQYQSRRRENLTHRDKTETLVWTWQLLWDKKLKSKWDSKAKVYIRTYFLFRTISLLGIRCTEMRLSKNRRAILTNRLSDKPAERVEGEVLPVSCWYRRSVLGTVLALLCLRHAFVFHPRSDFLSPIMRASVELSLFRKLFSTYLAFIQVSFSCLHKHSGWFQISVTQ